MTSNLIQRAMEIAREEGLKELITRSWFFVVKGRSVRKQIFESKNSAEIFRKIYLNNYWGSKESISGTGSESHQTTLIKKNLPLLLRKYNCKTILDAPCGDYLWMSEIINDSDINYIGGDIVSDLVEKNIVSYSSNRVKFLVLDICNDKLPTADLLICRDCLFHLSEKDINKFLVNFLNSEIPLLLTTTHLQGDKSFVNRDILSGDFRRIDLFKPPYSFSSSLGDRFDDFIAPEPPRQMWLFAREDIQSALGGIKF